MRQDLLFLQILFLLDQSVKNIGNACYVTFYELLQA